jgi:hypothetical protein
MASGQSRPAENQQFIGVLCDPEKPLFHQLLDDRLSGAFVLAVDDLLIGQHCLQGVDQFTNASPR